MNFVTPEEAAAALRQGQIALVPTETVVGLVTATEGLERVREIKGRDADKPIALLCRNADEAFSFAAEVPPLAKKLAKMYWPGPLTLVLRSKEGGTIGLRVPEGTIREVLEAYGGSLYATSANPSGRPAVKSLVEVDWRIVEAVDAVVDGEAGSGEASAVVDLSGRRAKLLRESDGLSEEELTRLAGEDSIRS